MIMDGYYTSRHNVILEGKESISFHTSFLNKGVIFRSAPTDFSHLHNQSGSKYSFLDKALAKRVETPWLSEVCNHVTMADYWNKISVLLKIKTVRLEEVTCKF